MQHIAGATVYKMPGYGAIYIAHNPHDGEDIFKVGKTERSVEERMVELTADTSNIGTYTAKAAFVVTDVDAAEKACHRRLNRYRLQPNREFFKLELPRLVAAVKEETLPFVARNLIPELSSDDDEERPDKARDGLTTLDRIKDARNKHDHGEDQYEESLRKAKRAVETFFEVVRSKALQTAQNLKELDTIKWKIPEKLEQGRGRKLEFYLSGVTIHAKYKEKKPPTLTFEGVRQPDDGRIGRLEIRAAVIGRLESYERVWEEYGFLIKEETIGQLAAALLIVRAEPLLYDERHKKFKGSYLSVEKFFNDPEEAFDAFEALIVENMAVKQYDVRSTYKDYKGRLAVSDNAKFFTDSLGVDNELDD